VSKAPLTEAEVLAREAFVLSLYRAFRVAQLHRLDNDAVAPLLSELVRCVPRLAAFGVPASVQVSGESLFCNRAHIKARGTVAEAVPPLVRLLDRLHATEIVFAENIDVAGVIAFFTAFQHVLEAPGTTLVGTTVGGVTLRYDPNLRAALAVDPRQQLARAYAQLLVVVAGNCARAKSGQPLQLSRLRRAMQALTDCAQGQENLLLGLTRFDLHRGDVASHLVVVTCLCLAMGLRLKLRRADLMTLCMSAVLHDVGLLDDATDDVTDARAARARVGARSALVIGRGIDGAACADHVAVAIDVAGAIAGVTLPLAPSAAASVIAVASAFDDLVVGTPERRGLSPDQALRRLLEGEAASRFDPVVLRLFASTVGLYPVGSWVRLSGGQIAVVVAVPADTAAFARPVVKVVRDQGRPADALVDLSTRSDGLRIVASADPVEQTVNVAHYLLS
jgi:HD-GYP domain-containing protein (c-di-GMP phosphodiesterase class II)